MSEDALNEIDRRVFGGTPDPLPPLQRPGVEERLAEASTAMRGDQTLITNVPLLDQRELPRARAFARVLMQLIQNTQVTAALPAHVQPPLWSDPVDLSATISLPAAPGGYRTVLEYTAQPGRWARISGYGVNVPGFSYDGSILWRVRVNGVNVPTLADWGEQRGSLIQPRNTVITLREGWKVQFEVRRAVLALGATDVSMALLGWTWLLRHNYEGTKAVITSY